MIRPHRDRPDSIHDATLGWIFTGLAAIPTLCFTLTAAVAPAVLGRPIARGTPISLGLVLGLALVVLLVLLALVYTRRLNRRDRSESTGT